MYQLYAVLVHSGMSSNSGHYYCYVKGSDKMWYTMNDNYVSRKYIGRGSKNQNDCKIDLHWSKI